MEAENYSSIISNKYLFVIQFIRANQTPTTQSPKRTTSFATHKKKISHKPSKLDRKTQRSSKKHSLCLACKTYLAEWLGCLSSLKKPSQGLHAVQQNKWNFPVGQITHLKLKITFHNIFKQKE